MSSSKIHAEGDHYYILKNHDFLMEGLRGDKLPRFKEMDDKIGGLIEYSEKFHKGKVSLGERLKTMLGVLDRCIEE